jgi:hypothetical protein
VPENNTFHALILALRNFSVHTLLITTLWLPPAFGTSQHTHKHRTLSCKWHPKIKSLFFSLSVFLSLPALIVKTPFYVLQKDRETTRLNVFKFASKKFSEKVFKLHFTFIRRVINTFGFINFVVTHLKILLCSAVGHRFTITLLNTDCPWSFDLKFVSIQQLYTYIGRVIHTHT